MAPNLPTTGCLCLLLLLSSIANATTQDPLNEIFANILVNSIDGESAKDKLDQFHIDSPAPQFDPEVPATITEDIDGLINSRTVETTIRPEGSFIDRIKVKIIDFFGWKWDAIKSVFSSAILPTLALGIIFYNIYNIFIYPLISIFGSFLDLGVYVVNLIWP